MTKSSPLVSVVIPTKNSADTLPHCLESIKNQSYKNIEVIVVDKNSTDLTREIAKKYGARVFIAGTERTSQFNYGASKAKGEFLYYIGSDIKLDRQVVSKALRAALKNNAEAVLIPIFAVDTGFWAACIALERRTYVGDDLIEAARFFTKKAFEEVGGYREDMVAYEEHDLWNRMLVSGIKWTRINGVGEWHLGEPATLGEIFRKNFYYGTTFKKYIHRYPKKAVRQLFPIRPAFVRSRKILLSDPVHLLGLMAIGFVKYTAGFLGLIKSYFQAASKKVTKSALGSQKKSKKRGEITIEKIKKIGQKGKDREIWRIPSPYFSYLALKLDLSANQVTVLGTFLKIIGGILFITGGLKYWFIGIVCFLIGHILDYSDGEVARFNKEESKEGEFLDCLLISALANASLFVSVAVGLYRELNSVTPLILGLVVLALLYINQVIDRFSPKRKLPLGFINFVKPGIIISASRNLLNEGMRVVWLFTMTLADYLVVFLTKNRVFMGNFFNFRFFWLCFYVALFVAGTMMRFQEARKILREDEG